MNVQVFDVTTCSLYSQLLLPHSDASDSSSEDSITFFFFFCFFTSPPSFSLLPC
jgi:hypothetical protein